VLLAMGIEVEVAGRGCGGKFEREEERRLDIRVKKERGLDFE
jgi:hypothetical protein